MTDDEAQGTMGRRKAEVRFFFPAFLCAQIFVQLERRLVQGREPLKWAHTPGYAHKENKDNQDKA